MAKHPVKHNKKIGKYKDDGTIPEHILNAEPFPRYVKVRFKTREDMLEFERRSGFSIPQPPPADPKAYAEYLENRPPAYYKEMVISSTVHDIEAIMDSTCK